MTTDLDTKTIGEVIADCVPAEYQHFFARSDDKAWWEWNLQLDDEDSVGTHVWNLLPLLNETLDWMPDADHESMWKAAGDQCLTWVQLTH